MLHRRISYAALLVAAVFFKTKEFRYLTDLIGNFARRILKRDKGEATA